ncbi:MAG: hypothetical protein KJP00_03740 [Bacteroidia bacterium]|nr:hypothetical protein [Bacteroidia bacterium]
MKYFLIEREEDYQRFVDENQDISWLGLDTEFIGERRFFTSLCLIQLSTEKGNYIIDPLVYRDIPYVENLIQDPQVTLITHAGANDFKLLYQEFGIKPKSVFDLQIATAFLGLQYPISFKNLVEYFLDINLPKSHTVTNWEKRPISQSMAGYAVQDVESLGVLYKRISEELDSLGRLQWCLDECSRYTVDSFFQKSQYPEVENNSFFRKLRNREKLVYLKMLDWRLSEAIRINKPKESVMPVKTLNVLTRMYHMPDQHLKDDRRINPRVYDVFRRKIRVWVESTNGAYDEKLKDIPEIHSNNDVQLDPNIDLLSELIKMKCRDENVAPEMVITKKAIKAISTGMASGPFLHEQGWRKELLGPKLIEWIANPSLMQIEYQLEGDRFVIS